MQFLNISNSTTLSQLSETVGARNVNTILAANGLERTPNIGQALTELCDEARTGDSVTWQRKSAILNSFTQDSDIFEHAALLGESDWRVLSSINTFPNMLKIPDTITLPDSVDILGNGEGIATNIYSKAMTSLSESNTIDPAIFNEYSTIKASRIVDSTDSTSNSITGFNLPWGEITLSSSITGDSIEFPVYPESIDDQRVANYTTMPDLLYQYEPWQLYSSSGPRTNSYTFTFHRDMWTGDHRDGKANELVRFCEATCYPEFNGSAVSVPTVSLYLSGKLLIHGVMTSVATSWSGPIGLDGFYLECELTLTITEISDVALSHSVVRNKSLIG